MFKAFYLHFHLGAGKLNPHQTRGCTVHIKPDNVEVNKCWMSIAWCNPKDNFCRKTGREEAHKKEYKLVKFRDVPGLLSGASNLVYKQPFNGWDNVESDFYWVWKYMV